MTMDAVRDRLGGIRRLVVPPRAVVSPAVRDELRHNDVSLTYAQTETTPRAGGVRLVLLSAGASFDPAPLIGALRREGIDVEPQEADCLIAASDALAAELAQADTLGVLLTSHPAAALCIGWTIQSPSQL